MQNHWSAHSHLRMRLCRLFLCVGAATQFVKRWSQNCANDAANHRKSQDDRKSSNYRHRYEMAASRQLVMLDKTIAKDWRQTVASRGIWGPLDKLGLGPCSSSLLSLRPSNPSISLLLSLISSRLFPIHLRSGNLFTVLFQQNWKIFSYLLSEILPDHRVLRMLPGWTKVHETFSLKTRCPWHLGAPELCTSSLYGCCATGDKVAASLPTECEPYKQTVVAKCVCHGSLQYITVICGYAKKRAFYCFAEPQKYHQPKLNYRKWIRRFCCFDLQIVNYSSRKSFIFILSFAIIRLNLIYASLAESLSTSTPHCRVYQRPPTSHSPCLHVSLSTDERPH